MKAVSLPKDSAARKEVFDALAAEFTQLSIIDSPSPAGVVPIVTSLDGVSDVLCGDIPAVIYRGGCTITVADAVQLMGQYRTMDVKVPDGAMDYKKMVKGLTSAEVFSDALKSFTWLNNDVAVTNFDGTAGCLFSKFDKEANRMVHVARNSYTPPHFDNTGICVIVALASDCKCVKTWRIQKVTASDYEALHRSMQSFQYSNPTILNQLPGDIVVLGHNVIHEVFTEGTAVGFGWSLMLEKEVDQLLAYNLLDSFRCHLLLRATTDAGLETGYLGKDDEDIADEQFFPVIAQYIGSLDHRLCSDISGAPSELWVEQAVKTEGKSANLTPTAGSRRARGLSPVVSRTRTRSPSKAPPTKKTRRVVVQFCAMNELVDLEPEDTPDHSKANRDVILGLLVINAYLCPYGSKGAIGGTKKVNEMPIDLPRAIYENGKEVLRERLKRYGFRSLIAWLDETGLATRPKWLAMFGVFTGKNARMSRMACNVEWNVVQATKDHRDLEVLRCCSVANLMYVKEDTKWYNGANCKKCGKIVYPS